VTTLDSLIERFLDDRAALAPDDLDALIAGLKAEPARAVALREHLMIDDLLAQKLTVDRRNFLAQVEQRIADFERSEAEIDEQVAELRELATQAYVTSQRDGPARGLLAARWVQAAIALSLVAVVAGVFLVPRWLPERRLAVAHVVTVQGPVVLTEDDAVTPAAQAATLFTGQQIETPADGWLTLQYDDQTQIRVGAGSVVRLGHERASGAKRVHISRGELWADVARQPAGAMELSTPHAVAVVLGTQLRLTVTSDDTLLEVTEGLVRLDRPDRQDSIEVAAAESGLATDAELHRRPVAWPASTAGLVYAFDPFVRRVPRVRQPGGGERWYTSPLAAVGSAAINEFDDALELTGGHFHSRDDGEDIVALAGGSEEFTLEIVVAPGANAAGKTGRVISLEADDGAANFALSQAGAEWSFVLRTTVAEEPMPLRFVVPDDSGQAARHPLHLAVTYGSGRLAAYVAGRPLGPGIELRGSLAAWQGASLLIGADARGNEAWKGTIHALAIYHRCLDADEVAQNVRNYQRLAGSQP
jgi:hypothetical protein